MNDIEVSGDDRRLYVPHPYPLEGQFIGGLASVIAREMKRSPDALERVTFISGDSREGNIGGVNVLNALPERPEEAGKTMSRRMWHMWCALHPESYTAPSMPREALERMYRGDYESAEFDVAKLVEHTDQFGPSSEALRSFFERYEQRLRNVEPGSTVNFQDFVWFAALNEYGDELRAKGVELVSYLHTSLPDNLIESEVGRTMLEAISKVDRFYAHTDAFVQNAGRQLEALGLRIPDLARFDLGIDTAIIDAAVTEITPENYQSTIPGVSLLPEAQQKFLDTFFRAKREGIPNIFLCADARIDPIKGQDVILEAVERVLDERVRAEGMDAVKKEMQFFLIPQGIDVTQQDPYNLSHNYGVWVEQKIASLTERFPEIVHRGEPLKGDQRAALYALMRGAHIVSGGRGEGLHLSFMEGLYANRGLNFGGILPYGAGFGRHAVDSGYGSSAYFPVPSDVDAYYQSIQALVRAKSSDGTFLTDHTAEIVERLIVPRDHSVLFDSFNP